MKKNKNQWIDDGGTNYHSVENNIRGNESAKWKRERERETMKTSASTSRKLKQKEKCHWNEVKSEKSACT